MSDATPTFQLCVFSCGGPAWADQLTLTASHVDAALLEAWVMLAVWDRASDDPGAGGYRAYLRGGDGTCIDMVR